MTTTASRIRMKQLAASLSAIFALSGFATQAIASVDTVTSCADDNTAGTLRQVVAGAASGDQIDMTGLKCGTITLSQGEIVIPHNVSLIGPSAKSLTIDGNRRGRVLHSTSVDSPSPYLNISGVLITGGNVFSRGSAEGGCILATGSVNLVDAVVDSCSAHSLSGDGHGGAIAAQTVSLQSSTVSGSTVTTSGTYRTARGGGVYASNLYCTDGTLSGNDATSANSTDFRQGGGAFIGGGNVDLQRCTVDHNNADEAGGIDQIVNDNQTYTMIENSTITGNTATTLIGGFELFCSHCEPTPLQLVNSTVAFNTASSFYAGVSSNGEVAAQSSIVSNNLLQPSGTEADLYAYTMSGADNLVIATNTTPAAGVITVTADPQLQPLGNYGGMTQTLALPAGSPASGMGNDNAGLGTDQRGPGFTRSVNGATDIGAYEQQGTQMLRKPRY